MVTRTIERERPALHGLVVPAPAPDRPIARAVPGVTGLVLCLLVATAAVAGIAGGLLRAGSLAWPVTAGWVGQAAATHAALMICAFMGTVIGVERAVAVKARAAWLAPLLSALSGPAMLSGHLGLAQDLLVGAALVFVGVNLLVLKRQRAPHTGLLLGGALAWLVGNLSYAFALPGESVIAWWFTFLVMTIAAERLEMTRLMRRRPLTQPSLVAALSLLAAGSALSAIWPRVGGALFGLALVALAAWLAAFDVARRTLLGKGLARYMAVCLLGGYAWLGVAGLAWSATALGFPARDIALHALGIGFVVSMMMGHAPVILPAVLRVKLLFGRLFYLPLAVLHLSLGARLIAGGANPAWRAQGALFNAIAIALFAATVAHAAIAWRHADRRTRVGE